MGLLTLGMQIDAKDILDATKNMIYNTFIVVCQHEGRTAKDTSTFASRRLGMAMVKNASDYIF